MGDCRENEHRDHGLLFLSTKEVNRGYPEAD